VNKSGGVRRKLSRGKDKTQKKRFQSVGDRLHVFGGDAVKRDCLSNFLRGEVRLGDGCRRRNFGVKYLAKKAVPVHKINSSLRKGKKTTGRRNRGKDPGRIL